MRTDGGWAGRVFLYLALALPCAGALRAQSVGSISGRVLDSSGSSLPGAQTTATNSETGVSRSATTGADGSFNFLSLPVGRYDVTAKKEGFKAEIQNGIVLLVGQDAVVNFNLEVGQLTQQVTVSSELPIVNTTTEQVSGLVGEQEIKDLPLNGRSFDNLITLNTGSINFSSVKNTSSPTQGGFGHLFSIAGRNPQENQFLLNGVQYAGTGLQSDIPG